VPLVMVILMLMNGNYRLPIGPIKVGRPRGANLGSMGNNRRNTHISLPCCLTGQMHVYTVPCMKYVRVLAVRIGGGGKGIDNSCCNCCGTHCT
jgi:hypothetical protein